MVTVTAIPAFKDNYLWLIEADSHCYIVDPGDGLVVHQWLQRRGKRLSAILITHHHRDHIGGIDMLLRHYPVPIYGPHSDYIPQITHPLTDNDRLSLPGLPLKAIAVPGHTMDHIAYFTHPEKQDPLLFCGDTLFAGGCGRIFDGTAERLHNSLTKLSRLPGETRVFCAHEYTLANLQFARTIEQNNKDLMKRIGVEEQKRMHNQPTLPTTMAIERATNPFLRCQHDNIKRNVEKHYQTTISSELEVFTLMRQWKDNFNG